ncbi:unnamed protein product [Microthlaspi erraticum]|uniref:Uncharacterized protein n=1 Tax=Microthlaspi erraticum TaxID=1685480 RepID=A0A6D2HLZ3_9BRAS|nr:unnamed protein product [Microthlaspi erraticum]
MPSLRVGNRLRTYKPGLDRVEAWPVELRNSTGWSSRRSSWSSRWLLPSSFAYPGSLKKVALLWEKALDAVEKMLEARLWESKAARDLVEDDEVEANDYAPPLRLDLRFHLAEFCFDS